MATLTFAMSAVYAVVFFNLGLKITTAGTENMIS